MVVLPPISLAIIAANEWLKGDMSTIHCNSVGIASLGRRKPENINNTVKVTEEVEMPAAREPERQRHKRQMPPAEAAVPQTHKRYMSGFAMPPDKPMRP
mmetsp:Transcript_97742/g.198505  ORF Transcript_97742/g.198505 Transcript_97742/m.198505 type:complete len:99 (-) Transcript_97742:395-691(-)